mgnify:CR=1 FL=1
MDKQTLRQQFEAMNTGETMLTDASRPTIFVNAKRAKITVSTKAVGEQIEVTKTGELVVPAVMPKLPKQKTLLERLQDATAAQRLNLFEHFELCCGMNRGQCICENDVVETAPTQAVQTPVTAPVGMNDAMARFMAKLGTQPIVSEPIEAVWELTNDKATHNEDGRWYRYQYLTANPKKRRLVMVDEENHSEVIKIIGQ